MDEQNNGAPLQNPAPQPQAQNNSVNVAGGKVCAILAYLLVGIIWYFADEKMKKNTFAKFHVKQSLVLLIVSVILQAIGMIIPVIGWFLILPLSGIFSLVWIVLGILSAINGQYKELPLIGKYSTKFNF